MVVRLPRVVWAAPKVNKEQRWLPYLAPRLPLRVPLPLGRGEPSQGYPWSWSVYEWVEGDTAAPERIRDLREAAEDLAAFVVALQQIDPDGGPAPGPFDRGVPLAVQDALVRSSIDALEGQVDQRAVTAAWERALGVPTWAGPPLWVHADLSAGNLLLQEGRLHAVIDFGSLAVGDPACELIVAWALFHGESREVFRRAVGLDDATWQRGLGWVLSSALVALPFYLNRNPAIVAQSRALIDLVLEVQTQ
jgi:aminoglycoside phosphotransferase (APT) family kinase protein